MSNYIYVEHQLGFSSSGTIWAKQNYEQLALESGVVVEKYFAVSKRRRGTEVWRRYTRQRYITLVHIEDERQRLVAVERV